MQIVLLSPPPCIEPKRNIAVYPRQRMVEPLAARRVVGIIRGIMRQKPAGVEHHADHDAIHHPVPRECHASRRRGRPKREQRADVAQLHGAARAEEAARRELFVHFEILAVDFMTARRVGEL